MSAMSTYQFATTSKRALFRKVPAPCLCFVHSVIQQLAINWSRWESSQLSKKNSCRSVTKDILTFQWLSPLACHIAAMSGPVKLWDPLIICQSMIPLAPGHWPTEIGHNQPNVGTISDRSPLSCVMFKTAKRQDLVRNLPVTLSRYPF